MSFANFDDRSGTELPHRREAGAADRGVTTGAGEVIDADATGRAIALRADRRARWRGMLRRAVRADETIVDAVEYG